MHQNAIVSGAVLKLGTLTTMCIKGHVSNMPDWPNVSKLLLYYILSIWTQNSNLLFCKIDK